MGTDDILDAFAALWTAERIFRGHARTLPDAVLRDSLGLRMGKGVGWCVVVTHCAKITSLHVAHRRSIGPLCYKPFKESNSTDTRTKTAARSIVTVPFIPIPPYSVHTRAADHSNRNGGVGFGHQAQLRRVWISTTPGTSS